MMEIEHLLRESIGLDAASIGSSAIQRTIRLRMKSLGLKRPDDYRRLLLNSQAEWTELVEAVVVTETWFFRDQEPFAALVRLVQGEWATRQTAEPLRVLSLPCSSGEEPYSLAMALLEAGVPAEWFRIDAVDISGRALAKARRGVYGRNSFRGSDLGYRARWFQAVPGGFALNAEVRRAVDFTQANLLDTQFLPDRAPYDCIFCRNLLIYFDAATRNKALDKLQQLLSPTGVLFVGAAEQPLVLDHGFASVNLPLAFACRKAALGAAAGQPPLRVRPLTVQPRAMCAPLLPHSQRPTALQVPEAHSPENPLVNRNSAPATRGARSSAFPGPNPAMPVNSNPRRALKPPGSAADPELEQARRLADAGKLQEATLMCEAHLKRQRGSAPGWYLLGLMREAAGAPEAQECYRKALYLQPDHYESLLQLALLAEKNGDVLRARTYRRRAQRSQQPTPPTAS